MSAPSRSVLGWLAVALLVAGQWSLFRGYVAREVAWAYPAYFDQVASLSRSYEIHERMRAAGVAAGLGEGLGLTGAAGSLLPLQAALLHRAFGPSRLSALAVGFLHFALLQAALAATLVWLTGRWSVALLGIGLLLCARSPFLPLGGLADFRMDSAAASLMGLFLCLAIRSRTFSERGWSLAAGAAAALLVSMRTLTLVYLSGIFGSFGLLLLWKGRAGSGPGAEAWRRRWGGLLAACLVLGVVALPLVWHKWQRIHDYYVVGHVTGPDKWVHQRLLGLRTSGELLLFYPLSFLRDHAGAGFLAACTAVLLASAVARGARPRRTGASDADWTAAFTLAGLAFLVPLAVLTTDVAKSPVVAGILVPPALWLVILGAIRLADPPRREGALAALAALVLALGAHAQWAGFGAPGPFSARRTDVEAAKQLHGLIGSCSRAMGWTAPVITVDRLADFLVPSIVTTEMYERRGTFIKVRFGVWEFGEISAERAEDSIARSDFVVLTTSEDPGDATPFDASMRRLHPRLVSACERGHVPLGRFRIQGVEAVPWVRAALHVEAGKDGAFPPEGLALTGLGPVLRARPFVELVGDVDAAADGEVSAAAGNAGHPLVAVPADLLVSGSSYSIRLEVPQAGFDPAAPVEIRVQARGARLLAPREVHLTAGPGEG